MLITVRAQAKCSESSVVCALLPFLARAFRTAARRLELSLEFCPAGIVSAERLASGADAAATSPHWAGRSTSGGWAPPGCTPPPPGSNAELDPASCDIVSQISFLAPCQRCRPEHAVEFFLPVSCSAGLLLLLRCCDAAQPPSALGPPHVASVDAARPVLNARGYESTATHRPWVPHMSAPDYCGFLTKKGYVPRRRLLLLDE